MCSVVQLILQFFDSFNFIGTFSLFSSFTEYQNPSLIARLGKIRPWKHKAAVLFTYALFAVSH